MKFFKQKNRRGKRFKMKKKDLKNPLFLKSENKTWKKINLISFIIIILVIFYFVLFSQLFFINEVTYTGPKNVNTDVIKRSVEDQLTNKVFWIFPEKNMFIFNKQRLVQSFVNHPVFKEVKVNKGFKKLNIIYQIREPAVIIYNQNIYWIVDQAGFVLSIADLNSLPPNLPIVNDRFGNYQTTDKIPYYQLLPAFISIWHFVDINFLDIELKPAKFIIRDNQSEFDFITNEGWKVIFNANHGIERQLQIMREIIRNKIKDRNNLEYIDLRVEDWIYYK